MKTLWLVPLVFALMLRSSEGGMTNPVVANFAAEDLLIVKGNGLIPYSDSVLAHKRFYLLYYGAAWDANCRSFTSDLERVYKDERSLIRFDNKNIGLIQTVVKAPQFEVIYVSRDKTAADLEASMRSSQMPWPAVKFDKIAGNALLQKYAGRKLPTLVLLNKEGEVLADSEKSNPATVLASLQSTLNSNPANPEDRYWAKSTVPLADSETAIGSSMRKKGDAAARNKNDFDTIFKKSKPADEDDQ